MKLVICSLAVLFCISSVAPKKENFVWEDCGRQDRKIKFNDVKLGPQPIKVTRKNDYLVTYDVELTQDIPLDAVVDIKVVKKQQLITQTIDIPVPCSNEVQGSCKLNFCDYLSHARIKNAAAKIMGPAGLNAECPLTMGKYNVTETPFDVSLTTKISPLFQKLGSGIYVLEFRVKEKRGKPMACLRVTADIKLELKDD